MQIKRDYSQPFFSTRRRSRVTGRFLFFYGVVIGAFLVFVSAQFGRLQMAALGVVGLAPTPTAFASTWATQGYDFFLKGNMEEAAVAYGQAVSQEPNNINYIYEYGRTLIELNRAANPLQSRPQSDAEIASELGDHAIDVAPQDVRAYTLKASALVLLGDSQSAIPLALKGYELNSGFASLLAVLARAYTDIGRYQQGLDYGLAAVEADPKNVDAHRGYAIALIWVGERDQAIRELEDAININPNLTAPYFELAGQYKGANRIEDAIAAYEKVMSIQPRNPKGLLRMCETYTQVGQNEQAEGYCDDALAIDENYADAYKARGGVRFRRRNYEGAIEDFEKCLSNNSQAIECYYQQGLAYYYIGGAANCDSAWNLLSQSLTMQPEPTIADIIQTGLRLVTDNCVNYTNQALPVLPTPTIVPTLIGTG
ncbi:MAG: tetratricopeptide repeat protein [Chloroflexi bacterium]|nr:tetratricopeptide repeat protein [Chloroflexota bacterium]MCC6893745.1 tetratricopeptide repeat protein [Anaerolineae bacterium]